MKAVLYEDIKSYNDTRAPSLLKDTEARRLINAVPDLGGVLTRPGCAKLNTVSFSDTVETALEWLMNGQSRILGVTRTGKKLIWLKDDGSQTELGTLASGDVSSFQIQNVLYIGDGTELYSLGAYDHTTESGTVTVAAGDVVKNSPLSSGGGVLGRFYKAKSALGSTNLATANYADGTKWDDVTDTVNVASAVLKPLLAKNASVKEKVKLAINYAATGATGNVTVTLNGVSKTVSVTTGSTATVVATAIRGTAFPGWTTSGSGTVVYFTSDAAGDRDDHEYDPGNTGANGEITVATQGRADDNRFSEAKKCKAFLQHPLSKRVFGVGNPENPTCAYYSDFNDPTYFPLDGMLYPTTPEKEGLALTLLGSAILVGYTNSWWYFNGVDPKTDAVWKMLNVPYGPVGKGAVAMTPVSFTFVSGTGIYEVNAAILNEEIMMLQTGQIIQPLHEDRVEATVRNIKNGPKVRTCFHDNRFYIAYSATLGADNDSILVYDAAVNGFVDYEGWGVRDWCPRSNGDLLFGTVNWVLKTGTGTHDINVVDGSPQAIRFYVETKDYDCGYSMAQKFIQFLYLLFKQIDDLTSSSVKMTLVANYNDIIYDAVPLSETFKWGRPWGLVWGKSNTSMLELQAQPRFTARTFKAIFESTALDNPIGFYGIGFEVKVLRPKGRRLDSGKELIE